MAKSLFIAIVIMMLSPDAYAYVDPGIGSFAVQCALAGVAALSLYWRQLRRRLQALWSKLQNPFTRRRDDAEKS